MKKLIIYTTLFLNISALSFLYLRNSRRPASQTPLGNTLTFVDSELNSSDKKEIKKNLIFSLEENNDSENFLLSWTNFIIQKGGSQYTFCELYPNFQLELIAPEMSVNGEHPRRAYYGGCADNHSTPVQIKISRGEPPSQLPGLGSTTKFDRQLIGLTLVASEDENPSNWRVDKIIFRSATPDTDNTIILTNYEILSIRGENIEYTLDSK